MIKTIFPFLGKDTLLIGYKNNTIINSICLPLAVDKIWDNPYNDKYN